MNYYTAKMIYESGNRDRRIKKTKYGNFLIRSKDPDGKTRLVCKPVEGKGR